MLSLSHRFVSDTLFWITRKKWLIISFFLSILLFYLPSPEGLTSEGHRTLIIVLTTLILIISESIPLPAVAILILIMQVILGVDTPDGVASSFMSDAVFFIMGSLMLAISIVPVALSLIRNAGLKTDKATKLSTLLLFSIAYGCAIGSIGTPSGGGRNVIMIGYLSEFGLGDISYLKWMKYAYPMLLIEIPVAALILWFTFTPKQKIMDSAVRKLKVSVAKTGKLTGDQMMAIVVFFLVFLGWIFLSPLIGPTGVLFCYLGRRFHLVSI